MQGPHRTGWVGDGAARERGALARCALLPQIRGMSTAESAVADQLCRCPRVGAVIRSLAERATHRIVLPRRLPSPFSSRLYVSSEGGLRYLAPTLRGVDRVLLNAVVDHVEEGAIVWDIGANLGIFSLAAAERGATVVAVEPDPWMTNLLRRSVRANRAAVTVLAVAIASSPAVGELVIAARNRSTSHLRGYGTTQTGGFRAVEHVPVLTLDLLAERFGMPNLVKIDVEGAEVEVLQGARKLIDARPNFIIEVAAANASRTAALLPRHTFVDLDTGRPSAVPTYNSLAIPAA